MPAPNITFTDPSGISMGAVASQRLVDATIYSNQVVLSYGSCPVAALPQVYRTLGEVAAVRPSPRVGPPIYIRSDRTI